jgi:hypothetical protein
MGEPPFGQFRWDSRDSEFANYGKHCTASIAMTNHCCRDPKSMTSEKSPLKRKDFTEANLAAARIILREPERYAGLPLEWAMLWQARHVNSRIVEHGTRPKSMKERLAARRIA